MTNKIINVDPEIAGGVPVFYGTSIPVKILFEYLERGLSIDKFLEDYNFIDRRQVVKLLELSENLLMSTSELLSDGMIRPNLN